MSLPKKPLANSSSCIAAAVSKSKTAAKASKVIGKAAGRATDKVTDKITDKVTDKITCKITDVLIIGAGASGLYCALTAGKARKSVVVLDHANKAGKKILMSGGGRCNFTNYVVEAQHFIGNNAHFCKSALKRYNPWEFIGLVEKHGIAYHERDYGQLFCDDSSKDILTMLLAECAQAGVQIALKTEVYSVTAAAAKTDSNHKAATAADTNTVTNTVTNTDSDTEPANAPPPANFVVETSKGNIHCRALVIATGGLSIPTMGATGFGYQVAEQFGHPIVPTSAGLVPFTFTGHLGEMIAALSGLSLDVVAFNERIAFARPMLFTHRGLSGPAMLQLSNYWQVGEAIHINLAPNVDIGTRLIAAKTSHPKQRIRSVLADYFPKKLLFALQDLLWLDDKDKELANIKDEVLQSLGDTLNDWTIKPAGTEGYRTAEVTRGGIDTDEVSSKTFESKLQPNLYFIGEVLDVTGWLGGYNFQWAWASGRACGEVV